MQKSSEILNFFILGQIQAGSGSGIFKTGAKLSESIRSTGLNLVELILGQGNVCVFRSLRKSKVATCRIFPNFYILIWLPCTNIFTLK